jgi:hypothetical protein
LRRNKDLRNTFIHEFIHYLDVQRRKGNIVDLQPASTPTDEESARAYYNDPLEFNAFYQAGVTRLMDMIDRLHRKHGADIQAWYDEGKIEVTDFIEGLLLGGQEFRDYVAFSLFTQHPGTDNWYDWLTPKNRRKVDKRIFQLYTDVKDHLRSIGINWEDAKLAEGEEEVELEERSAMLALNRLAGVVKSRHPDWTDEYARGYAAGMEAARIDQPDAFLSRDEWGRKDEFTRGYTNGYREGTRELTLSGQIAAFAPVMT